MTAADALPSRRSCLSVPASSERKLEKAPGLGADELVLDLEDAVAAGAKEEARATLLSALAAPAWTEALAAVRVNAPRTPWCHLDLAAVAALPGPPRSIVLPKVESAADVGFAACLLDGAEAAAGRARPLRLQALVETAAGLSRVEEIAAAEPARLEALILGYADLAASLGRTGAGAAELDLWLPAQEAVLRAARGHGLQAIDGPHLGIEPDERFRAAAARARDLGFDGKWSIHPSQVGALNDLFSPGEAELERARAVIAALERAEREGAGAAALDGEMVDEALRVGAERVLARAERVPAP